MQKLCHCEIYAIFSSLRGARSEASATKQSIRFFINRRICLNFSPLRDLTLSNRGNPYFCHIERSEISQLDSAILE
ncbi:hypothetical protein [Helicobacter sp. 23-1045]